MRVIITLIVTFFVLMREFKAFDGRYWMLGGIYSSIFDGLLMMQWPSIKMDDLNGFYGLIRYFKGENTFLVTAFWAIFHLGPHYSGS